jgi:hypothetical protein
VASRVLGSPLSAVDKPPVPRDRSSPQIFQTPSEKIRDLAIRLVNARFSLLATGFSYI